ncbi:MAG: zinc metallopeptidase [Verrucomicrobia bacterium]|nr:zinc metallopeptidase [Verrucomicrobiota bacterium]
MNGVLGMMIFDQSWWLFIPGLLLGIYAQMRLSSTYKKYVNEPVQSGVSGAEAARQILNKAGLFNVQFNEGTTATDPRHTLLEFHALIFKVWLNKRSRP